MNQREVYPATLSEVLAMHACYALVALLAWMVLNPHKVFAFFMGAL